jgi:hypothetical protein
MRKCSPGWGWQGSGRIPAGDGSSGGRLWVLWAASLRWMARNVKRFSSFVLSSRQLLVVADSLTDASLRRIDDNQW